MVPLLLKCNVPLLEKTQTVKVRPSLNKRTTNLCEMRGNNNKTLVRVTKGKAYMHLIIIIIILPLFAWVVGA
jgi:hypothetical protein